MSHLISPRYLTGRALALLALVTLPQFAAADPVIKIKGEFALTLNDDGPAVLRLTGTASHLGKFTSYGEVAFAPGGEKGSLFGRGVVAFVAANGDVLVGIIEWDIGADDIGIAVLHWRDEVTFSDGTTAKSSGRFAESRPPGAVGKTMVNSKGQRVWVTDPA